MGGLFEPICMVSCTEGAYPPEIINWMHSDFQIEVENGISLIIEKLPSGMPRAVFSKYKVHYLFASPEWSPINCPHSRISKEQYIPPPYY